MKINMAFILCSVSLCLSACTVGPDYTPPSMDIEKSEWNTRNAHVSAQQDVELDWWRIFHDDLLESYIHQAKENNKDVKIALYNIERARSVRRAQDSAFWPMIDAGAQGNRSKSSAALSNTNNSQIQNMYETGFDASWALDIFGGNRRASESAQASMMSAEENYNATILATVAEVARTYFEIRGLQKRAEVTQDNVEILKETYALVEKQRQAGETSAFDVSRARGAYQTIEAKLPNLESDLKANIFALSVLIGQPPEALLDDLQKNLALPALPDVVPVGLRSDIVRQRPDIRQAERELAVANANIGVATAELFPSFSLTGAVDSQARLFSDVFSAAGGAWSFGGIMNWSVFNAGAVQANIDIAKSENKMALVTYEKTVLLALADVETALVRYGQEIQTREKLEDSFESHKKSVEISNTLFLAGEVDYLEVLDAARELVAREDALILSETQSIINLISLYAALGGGWS